MLAQISVWMDSVFIDSNEVSITRKFWIRHLSSFLSNFFVQNMGLIIIFHDRNAKIQVVLFHSHFSQHNKGPVQENARFNVILVIFQD
jgi:hypothetical protein